MVRVNHQSKSDASNVDATALPTRMDGQEAYQHFMKEALAIPDGEVQSPGHLSMALISHNVNLGLQALTPFGAEVRRQLPHLPWDRVARLPDTVMAATFADTQVVRNPMSTGAIKKLATACGVKFTLLRKGADALVSANVLTPKDLELVTYGRGRFAMARATMALAAVFAAHTKATQGKTAVTASDVAAAARLGSDLHAASTPSGGKKAPPAASQARAVNLRDRIFTLVLRDHDEARRASYVLWLDGAEDKVPRLGGRDLGARKAKDVSGKQPAQTTTGIQSLELEDAPKPPPASKAKATAEGDKPVNGKSKSNGTNAPS